MYPDARNPQALCCIHKIAHNKRSVIDMGRYILFSQYDEYHRCTVERIEILIPASYPSVGIYQCRPLFLIAHRDDYGALLSHACGCICSCLYDGLKLIILYHIRLKLPAASPCLQYL